MTVYALLVGINKYQAVRDLRGCVADVERFESFLRARVKAEELAEPLVLLDEQATRQGIIDGFQNYLSQAQDGDTALFYYSGHGSQEPAPPEFWAVEPDRLNETLVCHDSRAASNSWDLADKELACLIEQLAQDNPKLHTVVILDSCHSGSGTRDDEAEGIRMSPANNHRRPLESYLIQQPPAGSRVGNHWYQPPTGNHILMTACRPEELARERVLGEAQAVQGVFSYYLREALQRSGPDLTYRDLFKHVSAMVRLQFSSQTPQLETQATSIRQKFLGGDLLQPRVTTYSLSFNGNDWVIDGGHIHGLSSPVDEGDRIETTKLTVFPKEQAELDLAEALGSTTVLTVHATESKVEGTLTQADGQTMTLDKNDTYKAVVIASPLPRLIVQLSGDEKALPAVAELIEASTYLRALEKTAEIGQAKLSLTALEEEQVYRIRRVQDSLALFIDTPYSDPKLTVQRLEQIARWFKIYELHNLDSNIKSDDVTLSVTSVDKDGKSSEVDPTNVINLRYKMIDETLQKPGLKIEITNHTNQAMYAALVNVAPSYKVWPVALPGSLSMVKLEPNCSVLVAEGNRIAMSIPDHLPDTVTEINDLFKLIVSTKPFDPTILEEPSLPVEYKDGGKGVTKYKSADLVDSLTALLGRIPFRDGNVEVTTLSDWRTIDLNVTTTRPQSQIEVTARGGDIELGEGIRLTNESELNATIRLMTDPESARSVGNLGVPEWLREDPPQHSQPLAFVPTRSGEPSLSVLALDEVENAQSVTPDSPLKLWLLTSLAHDERVLAYGFDGQFYLPLGVATPHDGGVAISLRQLPEPGGYRSLSNSIRVYFHKLKQDYLGIPSDYPRLSMVTQVDGTLVYNDDETVIRQAVIEKNKILLYIHGILGETQSMLQQQAWTGDPDTLILAFDYENLATGIQPTAEALRQKLEAVGLTPNHGKLLDILAHSMGGLVSRYLIEHINGGAAIVSHLYMFGTPNGGSPWPTIQDYAIALLSMGLNGLGYLSWPIPAAAALTGAVTGLLGYIEKEDRMLDEMSPQSDLIKILAQSPAPKTPYTIFAGDTSLTSNASIVADNRPSLIADLMQRLKLTQRLHKIASLSFLNQPNDIAVSVESCYNFPKNWTLPPTQQTVACDHLTYFTAEASLNTLQTALVVGQGEA